MELTFWRALLAPLTSLQALRLQRRSKNGLSYDAAWRQARMLRAPDEMVYRLSGHQIPPETTPHHNAPRMPVHRQTGRRDADPR